MRQPIPDLGLYICGKDEVAAVGGAVQAIFDCTSEGASRHPHMGKVRHVPPSGKNDHHWSPKDLDLITDLVSGSIRSGSKVLIHCGRGVSRSTCAAAAVLLHMGRASSVTEAVALACHPDRQPVKTALASLNSWWAGRCQLPLF